MGIPSLVIEIISPQAMGYGQETLCLHEFHAFNTI